MRRVPLTVLIGAVIALFGVLRFTCSRQENPVTGKAQYVMLSPAQESALGLSSARQVASRFGGEVQDRVLAPYVELVGQKLVRSSLAAKAPYKFDFHVLADPRTINAFALPGGQVFITVALLERMRSESQLAGVLGHEIGHVIARHGAQHLAKQQLGGALVTAVQVGSYDPNHPERGRAAAALAMATNTLINLKYGREDELESDGLGFEIMTQAGYDPRGIVELMEILKRAAGGSRQPEFLSTHPDPGNRSERLTQLLKERYPGGMPPALTRNEEAYRQRVLDVLAGRGARGPMPGEAPSPRRGDDVLPPRPQPGRALPPDRL
jgi:predicted Zn-dependent protease